MMRTLIIAALAVFMTAGFLSAQNVEFEKGNFDNEAGLREAINNMRRGNNLYYQNKPALYPEALFYFLKANDFNPNNADLNYKIGISCLLSDQKMKSLDYLQHAYMLDSTVSTKINFRIGMAYQYNMMWDEAIESFKKYFRSLDEYTRNEWAPYVYKHIYECKNGRHIMFGSDKVKITNLGPGVNSVFDDYSTLIDAQNGKLYYTSRRQNYIESSMDMTDYKFFEDIYVSTDKNGLWQGSRLASMGLNTSKHDAIISGMMDTSRPFFIYRATTDALGDLFMIKYEKDKWQRPERLPKPVNSKFMETSACLSPDGNTLYFVSDRPDGSMGRRDIYFCRKKDGGWTQPVNMGTRINTAFDEECVYISEDGKSMYFSSMGHTSIGGYDVFKSTMLDDGTWSEPLNLGFPLNTPDDELFYLPMGVYENQGYLTTIRANGHGGKDIYHFWFPYEDMLAHGDDSLSSWQKMMAVQREVSEADMLAEENLSQYVDTRQMHSQLPATLDGIVFKIQIAASSKKLGEEQLQYMYTGNKEISIEEYGNLNRYVVGDFEKYTDARKQVDAGFVPDQAFIVAYYDGERISLNDIVLEIFIPASAFDPEPDNPNVRYEELIKMIEGGEFTYGVQIAVSSGQLDEEKLEEIYSGKKEIKQDLHKNLFKYVIGDFESLEEAEKLKDECNVDGAFVVYYKDAVRYENVNNMFGVPGEARLQKQSDENYTYRIQLTVSREPFSQNQIDAIYSGEYGTDQELLNDFYKLTVGPFESYEEATKCRSELENKDAFIVYYDKDGNRVTPGKKTEESNVVPDENYTYKIQLTATREKLNDEEVAKMNVGEKDLTVENKGELYRYLIGDFTSYNEAQVFITDNSLEEVYIVVYKNGKRLY